jgi:uncharacterized protein (TIGR03435 family)
MRTVAVTCAVAMNWAAFAQEAAKAPVFEVASVKASERAVGPDANDRWVFQPAGFIGRNATLRRLIAEAYGIQVRQVQGPGWLDQNEYEIEAKANGPVAREEIDRMLQALLRERFGLKEHRENRDLRLYDLVADKDGPKIQPVKDGDPPLAGGGWLFHGDMRRFADLLAVQLSIALPDDPGRPGMAAGQPVPVLDRTGLAGTYDVRVDVRPEPGADMFNLWQRVLTERLGLRLVSRRGAVEMLVVDEARRVPTGN